MNRRFVVYRRVITTVPPDRVFAAVEQLLKMTVGGSVERNADYQAGINGDVARGVSF